MQRIWNRVRFPVDWSLEGLAVDAFWEGPVTWRRWGRKSIVKTDIVKRDSG